MGVFCILRSFESCYADGNSQVQRHADKINVYIVTVDQKFDINVAQILEAFQSQDGNATQIANI